ncbi:MAG: hypothetical protein FWC40_01080 [Proteobacteria bacterium]|nr:hypothetical protein [Pseudomonadota bacterium]
MKSILKLVAILFLITALPLAAYAQSLRTFVDFHGELIDQDAIAVSGVLPLEFRLFQTENSKKPLATETHFVAVVNGNYSLILGEMTPLHVQDNTLYVAVFLDGKELMRKSVTTTRQVVPNLEATTRQTRSAGNTSGQPFTLECPKGHIVTGIEGTTHDGRIESLRLICSSVF